MGGWGGGVKGVVEGGGGLLSMRKGTNSGLSKSFKYSVGELSTY